MSKTQCKDLFSELHQLLDHRFSTSKSIREVQAKDESYHAPQLPDAVVTAHSTEEIYATVKLCAKYQCPIVPFGAGTSLEGQVIPAEGGISLDLTEMNKVLRLSEEDLDISVQPGVTRGSLILFCGIRVCSSLLTQVLMQLSVVWPRLVH